MNYHINTLFPSLCVGAALLCAEPASADTLIDYTVTSPGENISFALPQNPTPLGSDQDGFTVSPAVTVNGTTYSDPSSFVEVVFDLADTTAINFEIVVGGDIYFLVGPSLFSGPPSAPTMLILSNVPFFDEAGGGLGQPLPVYVLNATVATAPEPGTLIQFGGGFMFLASCAYTRRRKGWKMHI